MYLTDYFDDFIKKPLNIQINIQTNIQINIKIFDYISDIHSRRTCITNRLRDLTMTPHSDSNNKNQSTEAIELLQQDIQKTVAESYKQLETYAAIKENLDYEPGLFQEGISKGVIDKETADTLIREEKLWRSMVKYDMKQEVKNARARLKSEKKLLSAALPNAKKTKMSSRKPLTRTRPF